MDAETKRWFAHFDGKLDQAIGAQADFRERIVRLEERGRGHAIEHRGHRKAIEALKQRDSMTARDKARVAGIAAGIGAALPTILWLASKAFGL